jgi:plastocyanin
MNAGSKAFGSLAAMVILAAGIADDGWATEQVVEIRDYKFQPQVVRIKAGDSVRWVNREKRTSHSILFIDPPAPESERIFPDETWSRTFDASGTFSYHCGPHPEMTGTVSVE